MSREFLKISEAAERFHLHPETLRSWCRKGAIPYTRIGPHNQIRVHAEDIIVDSFDPDPDAD